MQVSRVIINNFRNIKSATIDINKHSVFVGNNNSGKSTIFEALDLVLGPDRIHRLPVVNEHDFFAGEYMNEDNVPIKIKIEVILTSLDEEQRRHFISFIEWWDEEANEVIKDEINILNQKGIPVLRVYFEGQYDQEEDDFIGNTYYSHYLGDEAKIFSKKDKRQCGFLYLRTLRTGNRALSLEHGSLLDIILDISEIRPQMWENILSQLKNISIASDPELGITDILTNVQDSLNSFVPIDDASAPVIRISNFTREHLRKVLTIYLASGVRTTKGDPYFSPFYCEGTGTINVLVLALLSIIADIKRNVIFAMEEPEIALPPYIQKQIIFNVIEKSEQALFTSHSPYVLEEFDPNNIYVIHNNLGGLTCIPAEMPPAIKKKSYREELRKRFCEALLSRRVLITEGRTEYDVYTSVARKLQSIKPEKYSSFDLLGLAVVNAETDTQISSLGQYYKSLGKTVFAIFDKQTIESYMQIEENVDFHFQAKEHGIENVVLNGVDEKVLKGYALARVREGSWPQNLEEYKPKEDSNSEEIKRALFKYFKKNKGNGALAEFLLELDIDELPVEITNIIAEIKERIEFMAANLKGIDTRKNSCHNYDNESSDDND